MRLFLTASTAALVAAALACGSAGAQQRPGWVDPPAKGAPKAEAPAKSPAKPPAEPAAGSAPARPDATETTRAARSGDTQDAEPEAGRSRRSAQGPQRRPRAAEIRRERRMSARHRELRFAAPAARPDADAPDTRFGRWAPAAQQLAEAYLDAVSGSNAAMVSSAPRFYAERVRFYGREMSLTALIADKRRFARRWPDRRYEPQDLRTACSAATSTCVVRTTVVFTAANPARGARSQGVTELALTISFAGERPVIVGETGQVVRRGAALGALAPAALAPAARDA